MPQPSSHADHLTLWQHRLRAMSENATELQHLESRREKLQDILTQAHTVFQEQSAAKAAKQDASRRLEFLLSEGRKVFTFLNAGLREHYGKDSEKLAEFLLMPFRGRRPKTEPPAPPPPPPLPEDAR